jgi:hypothetical protein
MVDEKQNASEKPYCKDPKKVEERRQPRVSFSRVSDPLLFSPPALQRKHQKGSANL